MRRLARRSLAATAVFAVSTHGLAAPLQPGIWEVLSKTDIGGTVADSPPTRVCISQKSAEDIAQSLPKPGSGCTVLDVRTEGNRTSYGIECASNPAMRGQAELTATSGNYQGTMRMMIRQPQAGAPDVPMSVTFAGRRIGDC